YHVRRTDTESIVKEPATDMAPAHYGATHRAWAMLEEPPLDSGRMPMALFSKQYHSPGTAPGTLINRREPATPTCIDLVNFTSSSVEEHRLDSVEQCQPFLSRDSRTWVQVNGDIDPDVLRDLGTVFNLHELALEDVLNTGQRPKMEVYDDHIFVVVHFPTYEADNLVLDQTCLFVGKNYLICLYPRAEDPFDPIRNRLRQTSQRRLASRGTDFLLYALLDLIVDAGFPVLDRFGDELESLEEDLLDHPNQQTLANIHHLRRELLLLRRELWPQRELINTLMHDDRFLTPDTRVYFRDCHDHSVQIIELLESFRDMATSMLDIYLSSISQRTNEVMRVLTIIATIFIPLTFVVGVYGMNFHNPNSPWAMPELNWYFGYPLVWGGMVCIAGLLIWYFKHRKWM
ncbi:MAG: magnesium/cobalt transporter CorA, partial [Pseudomonadota bacterium]|nr:magnesium/cobalt transporter CorA [Pseudomonadota bacterium]